MIGRMIRFLDVSPEHRERVIEEIEYGSEPAPRFYMLVCVSSLIASIGLFANSTAVIIGAMLVAPLMTPIFGIALSLVRGDTETLLTAFRAEILGLILAVGMSAMFGLLPLALEVTPEMLARTEPNLLDLMVAVFAGLAGSYAMVNEHLSPALPGVAIATAIVPPLANSGLCIAAGAYEGALGSFLLFLANFLSILVVASFIFFAAGMAPRYQWISLSAFLRRFSPATIGFFLMAGFLSFTLVTMVKARYLEQNIKRILSDELSRMYGMSLNSENHDVHDGKLYVLSTVLTPRLLNPDDVNRFQEELSRQLDLPVELIVRNIISQDISGKGLTSRVVSENLDGLFLKEKMTPDEFVITQATQVLWEKLAGAEGFNLVDIRLVTLPRGRTIVATLRGALDLNEREIASVEQSIRERVNDPDIHLMISLQRGVMLDSRGPLLPEFSHHGESSQRNEKKKNMIERLIGEAFGRIKNVFPVNVYFDAEKAVWHVLVEAVGTKMISPEDLRTLEKEVAQGLSQQVHLSVWMRQEAVVTGDGYTSFEKFTEGKLDERKKAFGIWLEGTVPEPEK